MSNKNEETAVSGIALVDNINRLIIQVLAAFAAGGIVISSQYFGSGDIPKLKRTCAQLEMLMMVFSVVTAVCCIVFSRGILGAPLASCVYRRIQFSKIVMRRYQAFR